MRSRTSGNTSANRGASCNSSIRPAPVKSMQQVRVNLDDSKTCVMGPLKTITWPLSCAQVGHV
eukprot:6459771-Amphidinium_carterae.1